MVIRRWVFALLMGVMTSAVASSAAAEADEALTRGRQLVRAFEYEAAIDALRSVLDDSGATASQRSEALELMAVLHLNLRQEPQARATVERLLNHDPGHELAGASYPPRVQEFFSDTRSGFVPQVGLSLDVTVDNVDPDQGRVRVRATAVGTITGVDRVVLYLRGLEDERFRRALMTRDGNSFTAHFPAPGQGSEFELHYYVEAQAPSGHPLARAGAEDDPLIARLDGSGGSSETGHGAPPEQTDDPLLLEQPDPDDGAQPPRGRWYTSWWFWTVMGVVVAGGTTAAVVLSLPPEQEDGTLGTFTLP